MFLWIRQRQAAGQRMTYTEACLEYREEAMAIRRTFGSWSTAIPVSERAHRNFKPQKVRSKKTFAICY
ncbi:MAG: hypothetical protein KDB00_19690 [Planctomycetales bacterium]|nr:hypothetical protein [Planctomycetales bacterium]